MTKTLEQIQDEIAKENGYKTWELLIFTWAGFYQQIKPFEIEVRNRYAIEIIKETIEIVEAHVESGCFDKEGALANALKLIEC